MSAITIQNLTKSYGKHAVLKGVDLVVNEGEIFALLGSNGAGKTTVINILTTLIIGDGGLATVAGYDVNKNPSEIRRSISLTGQFAAVDEVLTGRENLQLIGDLRHVKNSAGIASKLLTDFGLADAADKRASTYSGGMRRKLDIAMSLIGEPKVIFLDEPTTGLDPEARNEMWDTIRRLARGGTTIFLTTQYLNEADELADRIAVLDGGTIVANDTASELKKLVPRDNKSDKEVTLDDVFFKLTGKQKSATIDDKKEAQS